MRRETLDSFENVRRRWRMHEIATEMVSRLREALPAAKIYWEKEPADELHGAVLSAELKLRKFTMQFERNSDDDPVEILDSFLVDEVVDDFVDFFTNSIYPKEKFTRII
jgi:hypothetical protein